ncbi:hypothetical protein B0537_00480 [Desulforamulus ferrireducens]|uniref:Uncharacterized protein n=1 Tax=Desulforamulus ferrireducens TaxID=1833852 RepID=A0A1S6ISI3_9FIRM|nr:hypothetical protein B0537_00480 [Desulforamulus ferrireducens]
MKKVVWLVRSEHGKEATTERAERILIREHVKEAADEARRSLSRDKPWSLKTKQKMMDEQQVKQKSSGDA